MNKELYIKVGTWNNSILWCTVEKTWNNSFPFSWCSEYVYLASFFFVALLIKPSFPSVHRLCRAAVSTLSAFCFFLPVRHISNLPRSGRSVYVWCSSSCRCIISPSLFRARTLNPTRIPMFNQCLRLFNQTFPRWQLKHLLLQKRKVLGCVIKINLGINNYLIKNVTITKSLMT